jgi:hypothetical protein
VLMPRSVPPGAGGDKRMFRHFDRGCDRSAGARIPFSAAQTERREGSCGHHDHGSDVRRTVRRTSTPAPEAAEPRSRAIVSFTIRAPSRSPAVARLARIDRLIDELNQISNSNDEMEVFIGSFLG